MKHITIIAVFLIAGFVYSVAQNDDADRMKAIPMDEVDSTRAWVTGGGIGADIGNILVVNPKPGSGQNRIGFGGAIGFFANYLNDRFSWDNNASLNIALEKTGSGLLPVGGIRTPFKKSIDDLRVNSTAGFRFTSISKWSYAADFSFRTQLTPSYLGVEDGQVYAKSISIPGPYENRLVSQIFSPARLSFGLGLKYDPTPSLSIVFTPATFDVIIVENQYIANLGIHGTELEEGSTTEYENFRATIGAKLGVKYMQNFFDERLAWSSRLNLFSDYQDDPQNVDIDWTNELALEVFKNFQIAYLSNLYYDDDALSYVTDFNQVGGLERDANGDPVLRQIVNYYHQILVRYTMVF